jgi:hypothetical protein
MTWEKREIRMSDQVRNLMTERAISDDYIKQVIHHAETTGDKLYQPGSNRYLARYRIGEVTVYVEYSESENDNHTVHTAYWHKSKVGKS